MNRRKTPKYKENPFIEKAVINTVAGTRMITGKSKDDSLIVQPQSGEVLGITGFYQRIKVDKTHFIKLYVGGIKKLRELSASGVKVFTLIYERMLDNEMYGKDCIVLFYDMLDDETQKKISRAVWYRGISELVQQGVIAETLAVNMYWINIDYFFTGDRFAICQEYILGKEPKNITPEPKEPEQLPEGDDDNGNA